ncbi:11568_t:CDS:2 [Funneliformis geosporum]|uniref:11568_t:CDS:1 n=1 Tax=Funneliformis geosporum TaxID=1117311 RepID=A0A9W4SNI8_9GLOM|nr:11568_t:CDS:2 [Funneliformis geosporum]
MTCKKYVFLFFILSYLNFRVEPLKPLGRLAHSTVLVENKIYFFGGFTDGGCSNEVFYLDLSKQFNVEVPLWTNITLKTGLKFSNCWASAAITNNNNPSIYLIGGLFETTTSRLSTLAFDLKTGHLNKPLIKGKMPKQRLEFQVVADDFGNIYVFGGFLLNSLTNEMAILNTKEIRWIYSPVLNEPTPRADFTATILSSGVIVYIGGREFTNNSITIAINDIQKCYNKLPNPPKQRVFNCRYR